MLLIVLFFVVMVILFGVTFLLYKLDLEMGWWTTLLFAIVMACVFIGSLIAIPICNYNSQTAIDQFKQTQKTIETARSENLSEVERAALTNKILEANTELVEMKRLNESSWVGIYHTDEIKDLEFLK